MWSRGSEAHPFHVRAWGAWLLAAMLGALLTRNPLYLALVIAIALMLSSRLDRLATAPIGGDPPTGTPAPPDDAQFQSRDARSRGLFIRAFIFVTVMVALVKGLSVDYGQTVLFYLPDIWPLSGRAVTAEGLAYAGLDALQILATLAVFSAFSAGADYYALLRATPPALHQVGLVTSIAITFVPQTVTRFLEIREAQALRGHRIRRVGDLVPLVIPLLGGGMERSMDLAEAMEARGFSRAGATARRLSPLMVQASIALGLGMILAGAALFAFSPRELHLLNWAIIASGALLTGLTLWSLGRGTGSARYRRSVWRPRDTSLLISSLGIVAALIALKLATPAALIYDPFPRLTLPPFDPIIAGILVVLAAPVALLGSVKRET